MTAFRLAVETIETQYAKSTRLDKAHRRETVAWCAGYLQALRDTETVTPNQYMDLADLLIRTFDTGKRTKKG